ncbi:hypothetical protein C8R45DRAFT_940799 [Mycena sanguinolenta]|nr:hypothetical protein C8R45DRAFT_940799 [Mycena sanguinolenta]
MSYRRQRQIRLSQIPGQESQIPQMSAQQVMWRPQIPRNWRKYTYEKPDVRPCNDTYRREEDKGVQPCLILSDEGRGRTRAVFEANFIIERVLLLHLRIGFYRGVVNGERKWGNDQTAVQGTAPREAPLVFSSMSIAGTRSRNGSICLRLSCAGTRLAEVLSRKKKGWERACPPSRSTSYLRYRHRRPCFILRFAKAECKCWKYLGKCGTTEPIKHCVLYFVRICLRKGAAGNALQKFLIGAFQQLLDKFWELYNAELTTGDCLSYRNCRVKCVDRQTGRSEFKLPIGAGFPKSLKGY